ncbi:MAG TPA: OPT/YSL family transporter [Kofleriaceae bacterium]|nr:OPT/YSL family transporter [Kofleriaceae bacterium]
MEDRELSLRAVSLGLVLGIPLAAGNTYAGLKLGLVDAGGTTIVLIAFALFGAGRARFSPREAVVTQVSGSSAANMAVTAGLIGPIPALVMSGHSVAPATAVLWGCALAVFGSLLAIPFRRTFIEVKKLAFPSGRATGEVIVKLFAGGDTGGRGAIWLLVGCGAAAAALTVLRDQLHLVPSAWFFPLAVAGIPAAALFLGVYASPLVVGVGVLVGARVGVSILLGAVVAWVVLAPQVVGRGIAGASYPELVSWTLWPGAALMVAGSFATLLLDSRHLLRAWRSVPAAGEAAAPWVKPAVIASAAAVLAIGWLGFHVHPLHALLAIGLAAAFSLAGMQATGETDQTPSGPLGGLTQVGVGGLPPGGVDTPLHAGGVVNGAVTHSSQMLAAWKTGEVVGGSAPRRLLLAQLAGIAIGAVAAAVAFWLIDAAYGIGTESMPSPAAMSWKATADAVGGGTDSMPAGAPLAALIGALAGVLLTVGERSPALRRFLPSAVAMGIGFIVPAMIAVTLAVSAVAFALVARRAPAWTRDCAPSLASGLILGEATAGVVVAAIAVLSAG